jgi:hypothetical protein
VTERPPTGDATGPSAPRVRGRKPSKGDPVVHRALSLLDAFSAGRRSMNLAELSHRSGLPTSTTLRLATRLMEWGALERLPGGDFVIGLKLWEIASLAPRGHGLRDVAMPYLSDLAEATRQHVLLAVRDGTEAMLVERLSAHHAMDVLYRVGGPWWSRRPGRNRRPWPRPSGRPRGPSPGRSAPAAPDRGRAVWRLGYGGTCPERGSSTRSG